jgi:glycosyltransferase involved in cell wall biosynthesis
MSSLTYKPDSLIYSQTLTSRLPRISVVIPTFARLQRLRECLLSFVAMRYPRDLFEIIVVDDGSPEPIAPAVADLGSALSLRCLRQPQSGPASARNLGLSNTSGELVAFTDDDCRPRPNWLSSIAAGYLNNPESAMAGPVRNAVHTSVAAETSQILVDYLLEYFDPTQSGRGFFTSNNLAFPAKQLQAMGGFSSSFPLAAGEDREICARWRDHGYESSFLPDAIVDHYHNLTISSFARQHFNYGRGAWHYNRVRSEQTGETLNVEPVRFYAKMLASAFQKAPLPRSLQVCSLLALSQALTAAGYVRERYRAGSDR